MPDPISQHPTVVFVRQEAIDARGTPETIDRLIAVVRQVCFRAYVPPPARDLTVPLEESGS